MKLNKHIFYSIFAFIICFAANAQKTIVSLSKVDTTGFYAIRITPKLSSYFENEMNDIRLLNEKNEQIPFAIRQKGGSKNNTSFKSLSIAENSSDSNTSTIIIKNTDKQNVSSFHLQIKNNNVGRIAQLTGSNDLKQWFAIAENIVLTGKISKDSTTYHQAISFPDNNYLYFKLTILNGNKNALSIEKIFTDSIATIKDNETSFIENPSCKFTQKDSGKYSIIYVSQQEAYHVFALQLKCIYSPYVDRIAEVFVGNKLAGNFSIKQDNVFTFLPEFEAEKFYIKINDGDNQALKITAINTFQRNTEIVAHLSKDGNYHLQIKKGTDVPNYELAKYIDSIPLNLPSLTATSFQTITENIVPAKSNNKILMWLAIGVVIVVLGALTFKLTKEAA